MNYIAPRSLACSMLRLRHKSQRDRLCPKTFRAYERFGRIEEEAPCRMAHRRDIRRARVWLHVSGEFAQDRMGGYRIPLFARYVDERGHVLGWTQCEYRETPRGLLRERVETHSWSARAPFSAALIRAFDCLGRPVADRHVEQGRLAHERHYRYDDIGADVLGAPSQAVFIYDQQYSRDGGVMCATDFSPLGRMAWRCRRVHYPHRAHERVEEHRVSLAGPRPLLVSCLGGLDDEMSLDDALTAGVVRVTV